MDVNQCHFLSAQRIPCPLQLHPLNSEFTDNIISRLDLSGLIKERNGYLL
jgi:hypothetical protein